MIDNAQKMRILAQKAAARNAHDVSNTQSKMSEQLELVFDFLGKNDNDHNHDKV